MDVGWMDDGCMDIRIEDWMVGWMDDRMDGWMEGWMIG